MRSPQRAISYFQQGDDLTLAGQRYDTIVLNEWNASRIPTFRAANPDVRILLYKNSYFLRDDDNASTVGGYTTGANINVNYPSWFMLTAASARIKFEYYGAGSGIWFYAMDWGNTAWQAYWLAQVKVSLAAADWDGIFADDLYCKKYSAIDVALLNYADHAALQAASRAWLAYQYAGLHAFGDYRLVPNLVEHKGYHPGLWTDWLTISDGLMDEHFGHTGLDPTTGYAAYGSWADLVVEEVALSEAVGKRSVFNTDAAGYGGGTTLPPLPGTPDHESAMYGYCLYLLAAEGHSEWFASYGGAYEVPLYLPIQDVQLGAPLGARMQKTDGLMYRLFERGEVHVNTHGTQTTAISGRGWLDADTLTATQVRTLPATTGCILLRPGYE